MVDVLVDSHEQYAWRFTDQQASTAVRPLPAGDYAVERAGTIVAVVERKSLADLVSSLTTGHLRLTMADLATVGRAAVVVEDRWSAVFAQSQVRPAVVADEIAELQVRYPTVPIVFAETRKLAQEWTCRFLGAALDLDLDDAHGTHVEAALATAEPLPAPPASAAEVRAWARSQGLAASNRGRVAADVRAAYDAAHPGGADRPQA